jgi:hypothetical protein
MGALEALEALPASTELFRPDFSRAVAAGAKSSSTSKIKSLRNIGCLLSVKIGWGILFSEADD